MEISIGKNTLGGGKKMQTHLNNYQRSTHDLSFIFRSTMAPGVLVPSMKLLMLPGDTFNIETRCHTLTHPTIGPLFGSFKQQNDFFFCPIRLYNAMLHNNTLNIGLDMSEVKLPVFQFNPANFFTAVAEDESLQWMTGTEETIIDCVNPSSLPAYLGYRNLITQINSDVIAVEQWQAVPIIAYFDIFKNYYANKQEENFYTISGTNDLTTGTETGQYQVGVYYGSGSSITGLWYSANGFTLQQTPTGSPFYTHTAIKFNGVTDISDIEDYIIVATFSVTNEETSQTTTVTLNGTIKEIVGSQAYGFTDGTNYYISPLAISDQHDTMTEVRITNLYGEGGRYNSYELTDIDQMRENILARGRNLYICSEEFITDIFKIVESGKPACKNDMTGLILKTYQSDINTNWVNTEWVDGDNGINAITAIDTSDGSFTIDQLNLATKVYKMLNRIAVSDGSYNAWIQTVYTSGGLNHIETPLYIGGSSLEIEFQEVINNSGTEEEPLGTLAGRGVATNKKGGQIHFTADEPGYIMCITSLTPRVDYYQGNEWDCYLETMDDLHKPQLDGIGFQDRLYRNINAQQNILNTENENEMTVGKQPAWIEYMTNVNKTFGNFAIQNNEGWMCINRIYEGIDSYTTYVQPHLYNNVFADTSLTAQNFWIQIGFNIKARRVMSAKQIPNL